MSIISITMRCPLLLILALLLLAGCPQETDTGGTVDTAATVEPVQQPERDLAGAEAVTASLEVEYPALALDYLLASLRQPATAGHPPLERTWMVIAQLEYLESSPVAKPLRDEVLAMVELAGAKVLPQLAAAWLAVERDTAEEYIAARLADNDSAYVNSLMFSAESAQRVLAQVDTAQLDAAVQMRITRLLVQWHPVTADFLPLLEVLAESAYDDVRLQAIGMLLAHDSADEVRRQALWNALRGEPDLLEAAAEGVKLSGDEALADALVPLAAQAEMGDLDADAPKKRQALYAAYALTNLPGDQARLMRRKLLGAADPTVRWAARLGELLHGDSTYWNEALRNKDPVTKLTAVDGVDLWIALEPRDVVHEDLLPTFALAAQGEPSTRYRAALQLNRYGDFASNETVWETLEALRADSDPLVKATAWYSLGQLAIPGDDSAAEECVADQRESEEARVAAAYYLLALAEAQHAEVME